MSAAPANVPLTAAQKERFARRRQKTRSVAIAVALAVLVSLFYAATIVRMGSGGVGKTTAELNRK